MSSSGNTNDNANAAAPLATWEKHTKGIGSKLLQKFGFTGRLGANQTGIAKAIEVYVRPANVGLGFGDIDAPKVNEENHILGNLETKKEPTKKKKKRELEEAADGQGWKRQKYQKNQTADIDEYLSMLATESSAKPLKIIDMRGQQIKIITDASELRSDDWDDDADDTPDNPPIGAELLFNLSKIFDNEKSKYTTAAKRAEEERKLHLSLKEDMKSYQAKKAADTRQVRRYQAMLDTLQELNSLAQTISASPSLSLDGILAAMGELRLLIESLYRVDPLEFKALGFTKAVSSVLISLVETVASRSDLQQQAQWLKAIHSNWNLLVNYFSIHDESSLASDCKVSYHHAFDMAFLPYWRQFVSTLWNGSEHIEAVVAITTMLQASLLPGAFKQLLDEYVLPKLVAVVQAWSDHTGVSLHGLLLPWLPLLKEALQPTYPEVRRKLAHVLRTGKLSNPVLVQCLRPWTGIFDQGSMDNLLSRIVLPKLVDYIREDVIVNPANQEIEPLNHVLAWHAVLPSWQLDCLLAGELFPKLINVLITWLSQDDPDYSEVSVWYSGWKSVFPADLVEQEKLLTSKALALLLDIMQSRLLSDTAGDFTTKVAPIVQTMQRNNYYALAKEHLEMDYRERAPPSAPGNTANATATNAASSLKEVLELLAEQHGFIFAPKFGKSVQGKPIWEFGHSQIYFSNDIVYVMRKRSERTEWTAVSLSDLIDLSR
jgi:tuftelin-interacting protein 11